MPTLQDLLTEDQGPGLRTSTLDVYGPRKGLGSIDVQGLINYFRARPEAAMSMEELRQAAQERAVQQEMELTRRALLGDRQAVASLGAARQREEIEGRPLKRFTTLAQSLRGIDPDLQHLLARQAGFGLPGVATGELPSARKKREELEKEERKQIEKIATEGRARLTREETFAYQNIGRFINKRTGEPATMATTAPTLEELHKDYIPVGQKTLDNIQVLKDLDNQITKYEEVLPKLNLPKPGLGVLKKGVAIGAARYLGGEVTAELDAIRAEITQLARAFGGDSRVSQEELRLLLSGVIKDFQSEGGAKAALRTLKDFRDSKAKTIGIPGLLNKYGKGGGKLPTTSNAPAQAVEHLRKNPQLKEEFKAKYGYLPEGF